MTVRMRTAFRSTTRVAAVSLGGLALALGTAGCSLGGGNEDPTEPAAEEPAEQPADEEQTTEEETTAEESSPAASDGGGAEEGTESGELGAAKSRFMEFLGLIDAQDYAGACGFVLDPSTGKPAEGMMKDACAQSLETSLGGQQTGVDESMIEARDNGDGTVTISAAGEDFPLPMQKGEDGQWYLTIPDQSAG